MAEVPENTFGKKLKALREEREMSARALSRKTGLAYSHVLYLESDVKAPGDETLKKLAKALGVTVTELKADQVTTQVTLLLDEVRGGITDEHRAALLEAVERAAAKGRQG